VEWPRSKKNEFAKLGLGPPRGILIYGPPGCAKTTLAQAAAGASGITFISLSPADIYASSYVGEAEAILRRAFSHARSASPCILFFDEIDSILGSPFDFENGTSVERGTSAETGILMTFLNEMDGIDGNVFDGVLVLGATNRPYSVDPALMRPGRFDSVIYVPPPDKGDRLGILKNHFQKVKIEPEVNLALISSDEFSESFTGAEIVGACVEATMLALRESMLEIKSENFELFQRKKEKLNLPLLKQCHLEETFKSIKPLLSKRVLSKFTAFQSMNVKSMS